MPFTRYNDPKIENEILRQLNLIVSHLLHYKRKLKIVSIVLGGSFGRGEGSVIVKNGRIKTLNDYDIFIVVKNSMLQYYVNYVLLEKSLKYLYKKYPYLPYIEFFLIKKNELHKLPPKVLYYELKHGSKILYGDNVLKEIRNYQPKDIPLIEGVILLFNRAVSLLYAYLASCCGRKERAIEVLREFSVAAKPF
jgi:predicted nucleotidyltransferase